MLRKVMCYILCIVCMLAVSCGEDANNSSQDKHTKPIISYRMYNSELPQNTYKALNFNEQKAIWISYIELDEMIKGKSEAKFKELFSEKMSKVRELGINTVYVHVRAFSDAYYSSELFCYADSFGDNEFDALEIMIDEAHREGLSFHAWVNPMRCPSQSGIERMAENCTIREWYKNNYGDYVIKTSENPYLWLNPAHEVVRNFIIDGVCEIVSRYDIDGVHIDDYFYPTTDESFDEIAFSKSNAENLASWRTENINALVSFMYANIKKVNSTVLFGISPQGNINNNTDSLYADVYSWCEFDGFCDYIVPQVYFGYSNSSQPFMKVINKWNKMVSQNNKIKLIIGLGVYRINDDAEFMNNTGIIAKQINDAYQLSEGYGVALFDSKTIFDGTDRMNGELEQVKKMLPQLEKSKTYISSSKSNM